MTAPLCACGQPAPSSVICGACERKLADALAAVAALIPELNITLTGGAYARRTGHILATVYAHTTPLPYDVRASEADTHLQTVLLGWATALGMPLGALTALPPCTDLARWLLSRMSAVRQHEEAGTMKTEIVAAVRHAGIVIDLPPQRVYAGPCDPPCTGELLSRPGRTLAHCDVCGTAYGVAERQEWMRARLGDYLATSTEAELMLGGIGIHVTAGTIRMWHHRSRLEAHFPGGVAHPLYRLGAVIDLALARDTARAGLAQACTCGRLLRKVRLYVGVKPSPACLLPPPRHPAYRETTGAAGPPRQTPPRCAGCGAGGPQPAAPARRRHGHALLADPRPGDLAPQPTPPWQPQPAVPVRALRPTVMAARVRWHIAMNPTRQPCGCASWLQWDQHLDAWTPRQAPCAQHTQG